VDEKGVFRADGVNYSGVTNKTVPALAALLKLGLSAAAKVLDVTATITAEATEPADFHFA
jgi:hypothetical protein